MAGSFHRFTDPAYFLFPGESFPGTTPGSIGGHLYDRINVVSGGSGSGGSANADGKKSGGPNNGTYFAGFGEDGTSMNVNRGNRALAENLDIVDDILRTSIPKYASFSGVSPAATSLVIVGDVFVGDRPSTPANQLVWLVDANGRAVYNGTTPLVVTDIDNGTPGSSVIGQGWYTNPTLRFNTSLNVAYTVNYGERTTTARMVELKEREALWGMMVLSAASAVRGETNNLHGFDEVYRRATHITSTGAPNTPGSGATVTRNGKAITALLPSQTNWSSTRVPDPFLAGFRVEFDNYQATTAFDNTLGGDIGQLHLSAQRHNPSSAERTAGNAPKASSATFFPRDIAAASISGQPVRTYITKGQAATLNPAASSTLRIQVNAPNYFHISGVTSLRLGYDVILVTYVDGTQQAYVVTALGPTDTQVDVRLLGGGDPAFVPNTAVTIQWFSLYVQTGGVVGASGEWGGFTSLVPAALNGLSSGALANSQAMRLLGDSSNGIELLGLGYVKSDGTVQRTGWFKQDGSYDSYQGPSFLAQGFVRSCFADRSVVGVAQPTTITMNFDPENAGAATAGQGMSCFYVQTTAVAGSPQSVVVASSPGILKDGMSFEFFVENVTGVDLTMTWPAFFRFAAPSDAQAGANNKVVGTTFRWRGKFIANYMWMERVNDYAAP